MIFRGFQLSRVRGPDLKENVEPTQILCVGAMGFLNGDGLVGGDGEFPGLGGV